MGPNHSGGPGLVQYPLSRQWVLAGERGFNLLKNLAAKLPFDLPEACRRHGCGVRCDFHGAGFQSLQGLQLVENANGKGVLGAVILPKQNQPARSTPQFGFCDLNCPDRIGDPDAGFCHAKLTL